MSKLSIHQFVYKLAAAVLVFIFALGAVGAQAAPLAAANTWSALPNNGLDGPVLAVLAMGSDVYLGGAFTQTADGAVTGLNGIARFDTLTNTWSALPNNGLDGSVLAMLVMGSNLYVGGGFTQTTDGTVTGLNNIASFDTLTNTWSALPNDGLFGSVYSLAVIGSDLYVGGDFPATRDLTVTLNYLAKFDGTAWSPVYNELNGAVQDMAVIGSDLYLGGSFAKTFDGTVTLNYIARFNTLTGTLSVMPNNGFNEYGYVYSLAVSGSNLYVGGEFTQTADGAVTGLNRIARFDTLTNTWSALPNQGLIRPTGGFTQVSALAVIETDLYVGGNFTQTADGTLTGLNRIAKFDGTSWSALPNGGLNPIFVYALGVMGSDLYVGGDFTQTTDGAVTDLNYIAAYGLTSLSPTNTSTATPTGTFTNTPVNTITATNTPPPTNTPRPTNTVKPTKTPKPTNTPRPTRTPRG